MLQGAFAHRLHDASHGAISRGKRLRHGGILPQQPKAVRAVAAHAPGNGLPPRPAALVGRAIRSRELLLDSAQFLDRRVPGRAVAPDRIAQSLAEADRLTAVKGSQTLSGRIARPAFAGQQDLRVEHDARGTGYLARGHGM